MRSPVDPDATPTISVQQVFDDGEWHDSDQHTADNHPQHMPASFGVRLALRLIAPPTVVRSTYHRRQGDHPETQHVEGQAPLK